MVEPNPILRLSYEEILEKIKTRYHKLFTSINKYNISNIIELIGLLVRVNILSKQN